MPQKKSNRKTVRRSVSPKAPASKEISFSIDLEKLLVPGAILIAGLMISLSTFLGIRSLAGTAVGSTGDSTVSPTSATSDTGITSGAATTISNDPVMGDKSKAKIAIVEFSDYECPYCKMYFQQTYSDLIKAYVDSGQAIYVFRNFIAVSAHNPASTLEASAALCVQELAGDAKYYTYHDYLFGATGSNGAGITGGKDTLVNEAATLGIDKTQFSSCMSDSAIANKITADESDATASGQNGTPGFVIGKLDSNGNVTGYSVSGAQAEATFKGVIDQVLNQ